MNEILLILGMTAVTFAVRYPVLALVGQMELPDVVFRALGYVPAAVLTAIIVPALVMPDGDRILISTTNAHLMAGLVAAVVAWRTRSLTLTIIVGMVVFLALRALIG